MKWPVSRSIGARYQVITAVIAAPSTMTPPVTRESLTTSHRVRVTLWLQASRQVPNSSSRAISGAPMTTPSSPGKIRSTDQNATLTSEPNRLVKETMPFSQLVAGPRARQAGRPSLLNAVRIEVLTTMAYIARAASTPRQAMAWLRCCRQLTQIIVLPPLRSKRHRRLPPSGGGAAGRP